MTQKLEMVLIPSGGSAKIDLKRAEKGREIGGAVTKYVVSGIGPDLNKNLDEQNEGRQKKLDPSQDHGDVHSKLWNYMLDNVPEGEYFCVDAQATDTLENVLESIGSLNTYVGRKNFDRKGWKTFDKHNKCKYYKIGIVSEESHLRRFKKIIEKGLEMGEIPKNIEFEYISTGRESVKEKVYELLARVKEHFRIKNGLEKARDYRPFSELARGLKSILG